MYIYQYIIIAILIFVLLSKASNVGAFILLVEQYIYSLVVFDLHAFYYYSSCAAINFITGMLLSNKYLKSALCSYALVFVNIYGYFAWYNYLSPTSYDMLSAVIVVIQITGIFPDDLLNRICRAFNEFSLAIRTSFDNYKTCVKMYKNKPTKKDFK